MYVHRRFILSNHYLTVIPVLRIERIGAYGASILTPTAFATILTACDCLC